MNAEMVLCLDNDTRLRDKSESVETLALIFHFKI